MTQSRMVWRFRCLSLAVLVEASLTGCLLTPAVAPDASTRPPPGGRPDAQAEGRVPCPETTIIGALGTLPWRLGPATETWGDNNDEWLFVSLTREQEEGLGTISIGVRFDEGRTEALRFSNRSEPIEVQSARLAALGVATAPSEETVLLNASNGFVSVFTDQDETTAFIVPGTALVRVAPRPEVGILDVDFILTVPGEESPLQIVGHATLYVDRSQSWDRL